MELPKTTLMYLGRMLRNRADSIVRQPLPSKFLFLLSRLDASRRKELAALHRFWGRSSQKSGDANEPRQESGRSDKERTER